MWSFYIRNKITGEQDCILGYSWEDALRRCPAINNGEWRLECRCYED